MTIQEIKDNMVDEDYSDKLNTLLEEIFEKESDICVDDLINFITEFNEDAFEYEFNNETYLVLSDSELNDRAQSYVDDYLCEIRYNFNNSNLGYLDYYMNWDQFVSDELDSYINDFEDFEGVKFIAYKNGYNVYLK